MHRCLVLIDGQHYPPVVERALEALSADGYLVVGAVFLGGTEKTDRPPDLAMPVGVGDPSRVLAEFIQTYDPEVVIDLSDEPVLDHRKRFELISVALQGGVGYRGAGYRFDPPELPQLTTVPTVAVTGTGKRAGKTSVAIELARFWRDAGRRVCIVTMGRGGPADPTVLRAGEFSPSITGLAALAERGMHAASDYVEDAVFAGVDTIGTFRCGAGVSGETDIHNFAAGVAAAGPLSPELMIFEGSGTAIPPARTDAHVLVMPIDIDPEFVAGYLGPYRVRTASTAVVIDSGSDDEGRFESLKVVLSRLNPDLTIMSAGYEMEPSLPVGGRRVLAVTTAPESAGRQLVDDLSRQGASAVEVVHSLSDRTRLRDDLEAARQADVLLVEVKAAAVDLVLPWAVDRGIEVGLIHNRVIVAGGTDRLVATIDDVLARR
jgi:cyclic 2,3-diphosphoglycerate synthetase